MNNMVNIWRLEHKTWRLKGWPINVSPYLALRMFDIDADPKIVHLEKLVRQREPTTECKIRAKFLGKDTSNCRIPPPATWKHECAGVFEDPMLREVAVKNLLSSPPKTVFVFGFRDLEDANAWLGNDKQYKQALTDLGFCLRRYRCSQVLHGLRQSIADIRGKVQATRDMMEITNL